MIGFLSGARVRDADGTAGRIVAWKLPDVRVEWEDPDDADTREENFDASDPRLKYQVEVMTFDAGWVPLNRFLTDGAPTSSYSTVAQMRSLLGEADAMPLTEKGKHWPYKNKSHLGPGPRDGDNDQSDDWKCKCANYKCQCTGPDGTKRRIVIDKAYKKAYNAEYKAWRAKQG